MEFNEIERDEDENQYVSRRTGDDLTEGTKAHNLNYLTKTGLRYTSESNGDSIFFNSRGRPTVTYYPRRNRWKVRGQTKTSHGSVGVFVTWLKGFHGVQPALEPAAIQ